MRLKLIALRKKRGFSQYSLSDAAGISRTHYAQIEQGKKNPSFKTALSIKRVLGYNGDDIFLDFSDPKGVRKATV